MRLLPRRALVALGLAVAALAASFSFAAPAAQATNTLITTDSFTSPGLGRVDVKVYSENGTGIVSEEVTVHNYVMDGNTCVEGWVDLYLNDHRPANPFTACRDAGSGYYSGILTVHWPRSGSHANQVVTQSQIIDTSHVKLALCPVHLGNPNFFVRTDTSTTCRQYPSHTVGAITNSSYDGLTWQGLSNVPFPCSPSCSVDMRPEFTNRGFIDLMGDGESLTPGGMLVAWDGLHRVVMQAGDGNLVVYNNYTWSATWGMGSCLQAGRSLSAGTSLLLQGPTDYDSNLVVWIVFHSTLTWASVNYNGCTAGSFWTGGGEYLKMQTDGNLVEYRPTNVAIWNTGTQGL